MKMRAPHVHVENGARPANTQNGKASSWFSNSISRSGAGGERIAARALAPRIFREPFATRLELVEVAGALLGAPPAERAGADAARSCSTWRTSSPD
jgi:hypothetical protein